MMYKAIFRADGSNELGMGHIASSLDIASTLQNFETLFISRYKQGIDKIKELGYQVKQIPETNNLKEEIGLIKKINDEFNADIIIVDVLRQDYQDYCKELSKLSKTLVMDYFGGIEVYADIILNWSIHEENLVYIKKNQKTIYCLGPKYLLARKKTGDYSSLDKKINDHIKDVLITLGGGDQKHLTPKIINTLKNFTKIKFNVVIGSAFDNGEEIKRVLEENKLNYFLIENCNDLSEYIYNSDLTISAGGTTCLELAAIGTPFLGFGTASWEIKRLKRLEELGICKYISDKDGFNGQKLHDEFSNLLNNKKEREHMSKNGKKLTDGRGIERLSKIIMEVVKDGN